MSTASIVGTVAPVRPPDRREHLRLKARIPIEFTQDGTPFVLRAETTDISLGGCYVEMMFTLEVGADLQVALWTNGEKLRCRGVVVTRHPQFGNGIQFVNMSAEDRRRLQNYLQSAPEAALC